MGRKRSAVIIITTLIFRRKAALSRNAKLLLKPSTTIDRTTATPSRVTHLNLNTDVWTFLQRIAGMRLAVVTPGKYKQSTKENPSHHAAAFVMVNRVNLLHHGQVALAVLGTKGRKIQMDTGAVIRASKVSGIAPQVFAPPAQATRTRPLARTILLHAPRNQFAAKARRSAPTPKLQNVLALSPHHGPRRLKAAWW